VSTELGNGDMLRRRQSKVRTMSAQISDEALDFLLARAGLDLSPAQKADLKSVYPALAEMMGRVRQPRGRMAEPAHIYDFAEEDLR
jgi:hypothetical protein